MKKAKLLKFKGLAKRFAQQVKQDQQVNWRDLNAMKK
jgi:hypothetical protein